jgi:hypothetical protein
MTSAFDSQAAAMSADVLEHFGGPAVYRQGPSDIALTASLEEKEPSRQQVAEGTVTTSRATALLAAAAIATPSADDTLTQNGVTWAVLAWRPRGGGQYWELTLGRQVALERSRDGFREAMR